MDTETLRFNEWSNTNMTHTNGTPYSDEQRARWAAYKSNKDLWIEQQEREAEELQDIDTKEDM
jgi:hypothetical protein